MDVTQLDGMQRLMLAAAEERREWLRDAFKDGRVRQLAVMEGARILAEKDLCRDYYCSGDLPRAIQVGMTTDPAFRAAAQRIADLVVEYVEVAMHSGITGRIS